MARSLEELQKQYKGTGSAKKGPMGGRPGGPHGPRASGKPKNTRHTVSRLLKYVGRYWPRLICVVLCMLLSAVTSLIGSYMLAPIINRIALEVNPNTNLTMSSIEAIADKAIGAVTELPLIKSLMGSTATAVAVYVAAALILLALVYLVGIASTYLQMRLMVSVSQNSIERIRNDLFCKIEKLPVRYFDRTPTGETMSRFTNDIDNIDTMLSNSLTSIVSGLVTLIGTFVFMVLTNWILTIVTIVFIPIFAFGGALIAKRSSKYYGGQQSALGAVNGYIEETVTGQKVVKVFNHESECVEEFDLLNDELRDKQFKAQYYGGIMGPIMGNTSQITYALLSV